MPLEAPVTLNGMAEQREHSLLQRLLSAQAFWVTVALLIMCAVMSVLQPQAFASSENFYNITRNFAFIGIMALGMTTVIVTGGIDLSVGSVMGLAAIAAGLVLQDAGPWWLAMGAGLVTGFAAGVVNGVLIAWVGLPPFVVTLGTLSIGRSLAVVLSQNKMIYDFGPDADTDLRDWWRAGAGHRQSGLGAADTYGGVLRGVASDTVGAAPVRDRRQ